MSKSGSRNSAGSSVRNNYEEAENAPKPLAATLLQEFQNLREKLKNEDDSQEKGIEMLRF